MPEWNVGISAWIGQDGKQGDFQRHQKAKFAVEFYPHDFRPIAAAEKIAECVEDSRYRVHAQVASVLKGAWVVDLGVQAFQQSKPPKGFRQGRLDSGGHLLGDRSVLLFRRACSCPRDPPADLRAVHSQDPYPNCSIHRDGE
jgi:hypothetical protein